VSEHREGLLARQPAPGRVETLWRYLHQEQVAKIVQCGEPRIEEGRWGSGGLSLF